MEAIGDDMFRDMVEGSGIDGREGGKGRGQQFEGKSIYTYSRANIIRLRISSIYRIYRISPKTLCIDYS